MRLSEERIMQGRIVQEVVELPVVSRRVVYEDDKDRAEVDEWCRPAAPRVALGRRHW